MSKVVRRFLVVIAALFVLALAAITFADWRVSDASKDKIFSKAEDVPEYDVALLLGTSPKLGSKPNHFYVERIRATIQLWKLGKIRAILISGDSSTPHYNEPDQMKRDLVAAGVPVEFITCDYAGLRTLDSVLRASMVFGLHSVVIVSQEEHLERALYLASSVDLAAVGLAAADAPKWWQVRQKVREALARVEAVVDLAVGRKPKHTGEPVNVRLAPKPNTTPASS
jgi:SanA protein